MLSEQPNHIVALYGSDKIARTCHFQERGALKADVNNSGCTEWQGK